MDFIRKNSLIIILGMLVLNLLVTCNQSKKLLQLKKDNEEIKTKSKEVYDLVRVSPTKQEIERIVYQYMFEGLLYEEALDKKQISPAEIKLKMNEVLDKK